MPSDGLDAQLVDITLAAGGSRPRLPLTDALLAAAERQVRGDAMLAATVGMEIRRDYRSDEQRMVDASRAADQHDLQRD